jgi:hypothetical protein
VAREHARASASAPAPAPATRSPAGPAIGNRAFARLIAARQTAPPVVAPPKAAKGRPDSKTLWAAYDPVKYKPNGPGAWAGLAQEEVWDLIGGHVGNAFGPKGNTCAARLSWAFNHGGPRITEYEAGWTYPNPKDRVDRKGKSHNNGDGNKYIVSAPYMEKYLKKKWGKPDARAKTNAEAIKIATGLGADQVAVFAGDHHVGVMRQYTTDGYKDAYVFTDKDVMPVSVWLLP